MENYRVNSKHQCFYSHINGYILFSWNFTGLLSSAPTLLPARNVLNSALLGANLAALGLYLCTDSMATGLSMLGTTSLLSALMGVTLTMAIGGEI